MKDKNKPKEKIKYKVDVTRTSYDTQTYIIEAENEDEAYDLAIEEACNDSWGSGNAEYEVEDIDLANDEDIQYENDDE
jgi:hypothetical protein